MNNYYLLRESMKIIDKYCEDLWINGYLKELQIEKTNLKVDYGEFLQRIKNQSLKLYKDLLSKTIQGVSVLYFIKNTKPNGNDTIQEIQNECINFVSNNFHPFNLRSRRIILPRNEKWRYFRDWKENFV